MDGEGGGRQQRGRAGDASVGELSFGLFALALIAFGPPMLAVFSVPELLFGVPVLYVYLFAAWGLVIALLARLAGRAGREAAEEREPPAPAPPAPRGEA